MAYHVFISYSWTNSPERLALQSALKGIPGVQVLVDTDSITYGDQIHSNISTLIDKADCVVVLLTTAGLKSNEVRDEITRAHERRRPIVPVVERGVTLDALPWQLRDVNYIPYDGHDFETAIRRVVQAVTARVDALGFVRQRMPVELADLLDRGVAFIDVTLSKALRRRPREPFDELFLVLRMRETGGQFVIRVASTLRVGDAASCLAAEILPDLAEEAYEWTLTRDNEDIPPYHTFVSAALRNSDAVMLLGNHRRPQVHPTFVSR